jgi:hypothetical protein
MMLQENGANTSALLGRLLSRLSDAAQDPSRFVAAMAAAAAGIFTGCLLFAVSRVPWSSLCPSPHIRSYVFFGPFSGSVIHTTDASSLSFYRLLAFPANLTPMFPDPEEVSSVLLGPSIDALRGVMLSNVPGLPQPDSQLQFAEYARRGRVGVALGRLAREEGGASHNSLCLWLSVSHRSYSFSLFPLSVFVVAGQFLPRSLLLRC